MALLHSISSSTDLEHLATPTTLQQLRAGRELLNLEFRGFEMQKSDVASLLLLSNYVEEFSVSRITAENELKAEFAAAVGQLERLKVLRLAHEDVFGLARLVSPIPSLPATLSLTSISFMFVPLPLKLTSRIARALKYNNKLRTLKATSFSKDNSNLVPILLGSDKLENIDLGCYCLMDEEFFVLCYCGTRRKLKQLELDLEPDLGKLSYLFLKLGAILLERKLVELLSLATYSQHPDKEEMLSYAETITGSKFSRY